MRTPLMRVPVSNGLCDDLSPAAPLDLNSIPFEEVSLGQNCHASFVFVCERDDKKNLYKK